jgi:GT2 family glycosyltransferase
LTEITTVIAYDAGRDLGAAYNRAMRRARPGDWVCFLDHDAMWTTRYWYDQLSKAVEAHPGAGAFTACTNRIGNHYQRAPDVDRENHDVRYHRRVGAELASKHGARVVDVTDKSPISGVVICLSQRAWATAGGFKSGFLGVDNRLHDDLRVAGLRIYLLPGLHVYHWYRGDGDMSHVSGTRSAPQRPGARQRSSPQSAPQPPAPRRIIRRRRR